MSHTFVVQDRLALISPSILNELTHHTGLTSSVFVRTGDDRVLIARCESPDPLSYQFPVGQLLSLYLGGGKVLLAHASPADQDRLLESYQPFDLADGRVQTADTLRADLQSVRDTGYFVSQAERHRDTVSITAPVRSVDGDVIASINLVAHDGTIDVVGISNHQSILLQASRRLTAQI
ncbi:MAG: IclR family transcriptional regulator [Micrococcaceae bacterium]